MLLFDKEKGKEIPRLVSTSNVIYEFGNFYIEYDNLNKFKGRVEIVHDRKGNFHSCFISYSDKTTDPHKLDDLTVWIARIFIQDDIIEIHHPNLRINAPLSILQNDFFKNIKSLCDTYKVFTLDDFAIQKLEDSLMSLFKDMNIAKQNIFLNENKREQSKITVDQFVNEALQSFAIALANFELHSKVALEKPRKSEMKAAH